MRAKQNRNATPTTTETVFLRLPPAVAQEFRRQAEANNRKLVGHFTALVEKEQKAAA